MGVADQVAMVIAAEKQLKAVDGTTGKVSQMSAGIQQIASSSNRPRRQ